MFCIIVLTLEMLVTFVLTNVFGVQLSGFDSLVIILLFVFSYFVTLCSSKKYDGVRTILFVGLVLRVILLLWDIYATHIYRLPNSGLDTENFYNYAVKYAKGEDYWKNNAVIVFGCLVKMFGSSRLLIQFILMLFSIVTNHIVLSIMSTLKISMHSQKKAMQVMVLLPNYAILSSIFLRESLVTLLITISFLLFIKWWNDDKELLFWSAIVFSFVASIFHSGMVGVAIGYVLVRFLYDKNAKAFKIRASSLITILIFIVVFVFLYSRYSALFFKKINRVEELSDISRGGNRGGSSYASIAGNSNNIFNFIIYTPIRILLFLFAPLPFQIRNLSDFIAMVFNAFFYIWVYYRAILAIRKRSDRKDLIICLVVIALIIAFIFGWGGTNIGTNVRHRDKLLPVYIVILALTFEQVMSESYNKFSTQKTRIPSSDVTREE